MIRQVILLSTPYRLSYRNGQMIMEQEDTYRTIPVEDLGIVMVEHPQTVLTVPLLNVLATNNVAVIFCDQQHMPSSLLLPLVGNSTQSQTYRLQLEATEPCKKQIWKQLITAKIRNQASVLTLFGKDGTVLKTYSQTVRSGDTDNREGAAARLYWQTLMGRSFVRAREGECPNSWLNYGYSILRAATARALLMSGLLPVLGVFHHNRDNPFPLADDIMEPYRPFVDEVVYRIFTRSKTASPSAEAIPKTDLLNLMYADVSIGKETHPLQTALSLTTASVAAYLKGETTTLKLPELVLS